MNKTIKILLMIALLNWAFVPAVFAFTGDNGQEMLPTIEPPIKFNPFAQPLAPKQNDQKQPVLPPPAPQFVPKQYFELKERQHETREQLEGAFNQPKRKEGNVDQAFVLNVSDFLTRTIEMIVKQLEILKERISSEEFNNEQVFLSAVNLIDADISKLKQISVEINKAEDDPQIIRDLAGEFRSFWQEHQFDARLIAGELMSFKMNKLFAKLNQLEVEISKHIEMMELAGKDVSGLEILIGDYQKKAASANVKLKQAKNILADGNNLDGLVENDQTKLLRDASALLAEARNVLVKVIKGLKN